MPGACVPSGLPVALQAPQLFDLDDERVPKMMRELMEGGGQPTVEELLKKWDEGRRRRRRRRRRRSRCSRSRGSRGRNPLRSTRRGHQGLRRQWRSGPWGPQ